MLGNKIEFQAAWVKVTVAFIYFFFFFRKKIVMALVPTFIDGFQYYFIQMLGIIS